MANSQRMANSRRMASSSRRIRRTRLVLCLCAVFIDVQTTATAYPAQPNYNSPQQPSPDYKQALQ
jgi:hypothetical protein